MAHSVYAVVVLAFSQLARGIKIADVSGISENNLCSEQVSEDNRNLFNESTSTISAALVEEVSMIQQSNQSTFHEPGEAHMLDKAEEVRATMPDENQHGKAALPTYATGSPQVSSEAVPQSNVVPPPSIKLGGRSWTPGRLLDSGAFGEVWLYDMDNKQANSSLDGPDFPESIAVKTWKFIFGQGWVGRNTGPLNYQYDEGDGELRARQECDWEFNIYNALRCVQPMGTSKEIPVGLPRVYGAAREFQPKDFHEERKGNFLTGLPTRRGPLRYWWIAMELLGESLSDKFKSGEMEGTIDNIQKVALQILPILGYFKHKRLIHRDIKPQNLLFGTGPKAQQLHVLDVGLVSFLDAKPRRAGTAPYMSLRSLYGKLPDHRDDYEGMLWMLLWMLVYTNNVGQQLPWEDHAEERDDGYHFKVEAAKPPVSDVPAVTQPKWVAPWWLYCMREPVQRIMEPNAPAAQKEPSADRKMRDFKFILMFSNEANRENTFRNFLNAYIPENMREAAMRIFYPLFQHLAMGGGAADDNKGYSYWTRNKVAPDHNLFVRLFESA